MPTVTVVIPTYNRPELLPKAIGSVRAQTFQDFEVVVVDDGTKVRAKEVVDGFRDPRIRYVPHETNRGCSAAKNTGAREARGRLVAFLDDDDTWMPQKLELQVRALERAPSDVGFSFHAADQEFDWGIQRTVVPEGVDDYLPRALRTFSGFIASSLMFKREVFEKIGYLDESFPSHTDIEFVIRVLKNGYRGVGLSESLVHRNALSGHVQMGSNIRNRIRGREMLLERYRDDFVKYPAYHAKALERLATFYRELGEWGKAKEVFMRAHTLEPRFSRYVHAHSLFLGGVLYRIIRKLKGRPWKKP